MGGGSTHAATVAPIVATPTRSSADTQALAQAQAKRYANPASFTNTNLTGMGGTSLGNTTSAAATLGS